MSGKRPDERQLRELVKNHRRDGVMEAKGEVLLEQWDEDIWPFSEKLIREGQRLGSGREKEVGFCSLDCYAEYHNVRLAERVRTIAAIAARHRNS